MTELESLPTQRQKRSFSTHLISSRFYQPLDFEIHLPLDSLLKDNLDKIKVIMKLYSQASRPT